MVRLITFLCHDVSHRLEKRLPEVEVIVNAVSVFLPHEIHHLSKKPCQLGAFPAKLLLQFRHPVRVAEEGYSIKTATGQFVGDKGRAREDRGGKTETGQFVGDKGRAREDRGGNTKRSSDNRRYHSTHAFLYARTVNIDFDINITLSFASGL